MTLCVQHAGLTHRGTVREENEDNWTALPDKGIYVVTDGLGGHLSGGLASGIVVAVLPALVERETVGIADLGDPRARRAVRRALSQLSREVLQQTHGEPGLEGMGATVVVLMIRDERALVAHMGDSRAYGLRRERIRRLTKDHSIVQMLIDRGELIPEEARSHPAHGRVTQSIGMEGDPMPNVRVIDVRVDDRFILCTDGLTAMLTDGQIRDLIARETDPHAACERLIAAALAAGGSDNVTVVVTDVRDATA